MAFILWLSFFGFHLANTPLTDLNLHVGRSAYNFREKVKNANRDVNFFYYNER